MEIEIETMWHLKTKTLPVKVGTLGITKKETGGHINKIPGSPSRY